MISRASQIAAYSLLISLALLWVAQAADVWKFNPFTGKMDNTGAPAPQHCADYFDGYSGAQGPQGMRGYSGARGPSGYGVPAGGATSQILVKASMGDYSTVWQSGAPSPWGTMFGNYTSQHDMYHAFEPKNANIQAHIADMNNPHNVTANQVLPAQSGQTGKWLQTDGSNVSWQPGGSGETQSSILTKISISADSMILDRQQGPTESSLAILIRVRDTAGHVRTTINAQGEIFCYNASGRLRFGVYTSGRMVLN